MLPVMAPSDLIASGRDADVFALGDDRVLRRYRLGGDVGPEAELMAYVGERLSRPTGVRRCRAGPGPRAAARGPRLPLGRLGPLPAEVVEGPVPATEPPPRPTANTLLDEALRSLERGPELDS